MLTLIAAAARGGSVARALQAAASRVVLASQEVETSIAWNEERK